MYGSVRYDRVVSRFDTFSIRGGGGGALDSFFPPVARAHHFIIIYLVFASTWDKSMHADELLSWFIVDIFRH